MFALTNPPSLRQLAERWSSGRRGVLVAGGRALRHAPITRGHAGYTFPRPKTHTPRRVLASTGEAERRPRVYL